MNTLIKSETPFPPVSKELLDSLLVYFPDRIPDLGGNLDELRGKQKVIRFLQRKYNEQNQLTTES